MKKILYLLAIILACSFAFATDCCVWLNEKQDASVCGYIDMTTYENDAEKFCSDFAMFFGNGQYSFNSTELNCANYTATIDLCQERGQVNIMQVPEFTLIGAGLALGGAACAYVAMRRRK